MLIIFNTTKFLNQNLCCLWPNNVSILVHYISQQSNCRFSYLFLEQPANISAISRGVGVTASFLTTWQFRHKPWVGVNRTKCPRLTHGVMPWCGTARGGGMHYGTKWLKQNIDCLFLIRIWCYFNLCLYVLYLVYNINFLTIRNAKE